MNLNVQCRIMNFEGGVGVMVVKSVLRSKDNFDIRHSKFGVRHFTPKPHTHTLSSVVNVYHFD